MRLKLTKRIPIWRDADLLLLEVELAVRTFPRHHKYALSDELRIGAKRICELIARTRHKRQHQRECISRLSRTIDSLKIMMSAAFYKQGGYLASGRRARHLTSLTLRTPPMLINNKPTFTYAFAIALFTAMNVNAVCRTDVKADTPDSRFSVNANGTVLDNKTQLMWKQCVQGLTGTSCTNGNAQTFSTRKAALDASRSANFAGFSDWRVPNIKELQSVVERRCYSPSINETIFPNTPNDVFWSSSAYASTDATWLVHFRDGDDYRSYTGYKFNTGNNYYLRLVRSGQ
jgi:Protein of unknown function (DUF1566)